MTAFFLLPLCLPQDFRNNSEDSLPGTRDTVGQFRDCPGESWMVGNPKSTGHCSK